MEREREVNINKSDIKYLLKNKYKKYYHFEI